MLEKVRSEPPAKLPSLVPKALAAICLKAMAREPEERYASTMLLAADVQNWLDDEPVSSYRDPPITRMFRLARRYKSLATGVAVAAACLALAVFIGSLLVQREHDRATAALTVAEEYALQLSSAVEQTKQGEAKAEQLASLAQQARDKAAAAAIEAAKAKEEADRHKATVAKLESELKTNAAKAGEPRASGCRGACRTEGGGDAICSPKLRLLGRPRNA